MVLFFQNGFILSEWFLFFQNGFYSFRIFLTDLSNKPPSYGLNSTTTVLLGEWLWH